MLASLNKPKPKNKPAAQKKTQPKSSLAQSPKPSSQVSKDAPPMTTDEKNKTKELYHDGKLPFEITKILNDERRKKNLPLLQAHQVENFIKSIPKPINKQANRPLPVARAKAPPQPVCIISAILNHQRLKFKVSGQKRE